MCSVPVYGEVIAAGAVAGITAAAVGPSVTPVFLEFS
jgi:hypothetical protein